MSLLRRLLPVLHLAALVQSKPAGQWIDLSYSLENKTVHWPGTKPFRHTLAYKAQTDQYYLEYYNIETAEHMGTHMDAPSHFNPNNKWNVDQVPLDVVIGEAVVVNMTAKVDKDKDAVLTIQDVLNWEQQHGRIPDKAVFLLYTGWGKYWGNRDKYHGTPTNNGSLLHFPGIHSNTTEWLIKERKIKMYGVDTLSTDPGYEKNFVTHTILARNNVPGVENLANLEKLPPKGVYFYAMPMKVRKGSGAPVRAFAKLRNPQSVNGNGGYSVKGAVRAIVAMVAMLVFFF